MAKKPQVLGNDPFRRGAADRAGAKREESEGSGQAEGAAPAAPKGAKGAAKAKAPKASKPKAAKPAAQKEAKPAARKEAKPAAQKEAKPAAQREAKPAAQKEAKPAAQKEAKPAAQKEAKPAAQKEAKPAARKEAKDDARKEAKDDARKEAKDDAARFEAPRATGVDAVYASIIALRRMLHLPSAASGAEVDEFGKDADFEEQVRPLLEWVYEKWFRVETAGFDELPKDQPLILVANRAGAIPWDSLMLTIAAQREGLPLRPLVEDSIFHFPSLGLLVNRLGAIRASPENGERVLAGGEAVAVFPEGATGFGKPYKERYRLQRFGRGGFVKLALRTGALVVPISIMGSEEIHPLLTRLELRPFGFPFLPITPTFPWLGAAGLIPFPSKWRIDAHPPFDFREHGPEAAQDDPLVMRLAEEVRGTIQTMLDTRLAERSSAFL